MYACMSTHTCTHIIIYICIYIYMHIYTHTHLSVCVCVRVCQSASGPWELTCGASVVRGSSRRQKRLASRWRIILGCCGPKAPPPAPLNPISRPGWRAWTFELRAGSYERPGTQATIVLHTHGSLCVCVHWFACPFACLCVGVCSCGGMCVFKV